MDWSKTSFSFLSKNKRSIFHFHQELYWTYSLFCFTTFSHFSGIYIILSSPNFFIFLNKKLFQVSFTVFQKTEFFFFPLRELCKNLNKWKSQGAMSGENDGWIRTYSLTLTVFAQLSKKHVDLSLSWWKIIHFLLTNSGCFLWSVALGWSNWEQFLLLLSH